LFPDYNLARRHSEPRLIIDSADAATATRAFRLQQEEARDDF
jgi:hypothetical protein